MIFFQHTTDWVKGEILEAAIMGVFGLLIILCSALFWKYGTTPYAKSLVVPLFVVGFIPFFMGISGVISNKNRLPVYEQAWQKDSQQFLLDEKKRVEGFDQIFKYTYPFAFVMVVGGAILFFLTAVPSWKAVSLAMMLMGFMAYIIDYFASERATIYLEHINTALK